MTQVNLVKSKYTGPTVTALGELQPGDTVDGSFIGSKYLPARNVPVYGSVDANNIPNYIGTGTGLQPDFLGATTPITLTTAAGFGVNGAVDNVFQWTTDGKFPNIPVNCTSYLFVNRANGNPTLGHSLIPCHRGPDPHFVNTTRVYMDGLSVSDFFKNEITVTGGGLATSTWVSPFGQASVITMGFFGASYLNLPAYRLGLSGCRWTAEQYWNLERASTQEVLWDTVSTSKSFKVEKTSGNALALYLSSNGSTWDIANGVTTTRKIVSTNACVFTSSAVNTGANTVTIASNLFEDGDMVEWVTSGTLPAPFAIKTPYYVNASGSDLTFHATRADALAGINPIDITSGGTGVHRLYPWYHIAVDWNGSTYRLYVDGVVQASVSSSTAIHTGSSALGFRIGNDSANTPLNAQGYFFDVVITNGQARYAGAFTALDARISPGTLYWYDDVSHVMKVGDPSRWATSEIVFVGEATAGASSVSNVLSYRFNGRFVSSLIPIGVSTTINIAQALGGMPKNIYLKARNKEAEYGFRPGNEVLVAHTTQSVGHTCVLYDAMMVWRWANSFTPFTIENLASGGQVNLTVARWDLILEANL